MGTAAAAQAAEAISRAIRENGLARVIGASAPSQLEFLAALVQHVEIDWKEVELFHLDEYIGVPVTHPASFTLFLNQHFVSKTGIRHFYFLDGSRDPAEVIQEANESVSAAPIDIAFLGIGENGHIAFNDPPADFGTQEPFIIVKLAETCRRQQINDGCFSNIADVPHEAISMSVQQILKAKELMAVAPGPRKAEAMRACFNGEITPMAPASILRMHPNTTIYLDNHSAALLDPERIAALSASA